MTGDSRRAGGASRRTMGRALGRPGGTTRSDPWLSSHAERVAPCHPACSESEAPVAGSARAALGERRERLSAPLRGAPSARWGALTGTCASIETERRSTNAGVAPPRTRLIEARGPKSDSVGSRALSASPGSCFGVAPRSLRGAPHSPRGSAHSLSGSRKPSSRPQAARKCAARRFESCHACNRVCHNGRLPIFLFIL